jgi:predicted outer membrane repeat protein
MTRSTLIVTRRRITGGLERPGQTPWFSYLLSHARTNRTQEVSTMKAIATICIIGVVLACAGQAAAQTYLISQPGAVTTCSGSFYDSGGAAGNYANNENYTKTFYPATTGTPLCFVFTSFSVEAGYDFLRIYGGNSTSAPLIGTYTGTAGPGTVTSTAPDGSLTFNFTSDYSVVSSGWAATISCALLNDNCADATPITDVVNLPFNTSGATVDGPGLCMSSPNIWSCYTAPCSGQVHVSLCGSSYDTMLAVYDGCSCSPVGTLLGCNDDSDCSSSTLHSQVWFAATEGQDYLIEVGGFASLTGAGLLSVNCQEPRTWSVCQDGSGDFTTIAAGLTAAQAGDTILVCPGTYTENNLQMKSGVTLRSQTGDPNSVTIDGQGQGPIIYCDSVDSTASIEGLTLANGVSIISGGIFLQGSSPSITNCVFHHNGHNGGEGGGAMYIHFYSSPAITGCVFMLNWAFSSVPEYYPDGGAVWCDFYCDPTFTDCSFSGNSAKDDGGALACDRYCQPVLTACTFTENQSALDPDGAGNSGGGAIYCDADHYAQGPPPSMSPTITLTDCTFSHNVTVDSGSSGGAVLCYHYSTSVVSGCNFMENAAPYHGGGLLCSDNSPSTVTACTFSGNLAEEWGGMACDHDSPSTITGCRFEYNGATIGDGGGLATFCFATIEECEFDHNQAGGHGAGMTAMGASPTLSRCRFSHNSAGTNGGGFSGFVFAGRLDYCTFYDNSSTGPETCGGGAYFGNLSTPTLANCTFCRNAAPHGGAIGIGYLDRPSLVTIDNTIIAFSTQGEAVYCEPTCPGCSAILACCCVYGNAGGDYVGCIAGQNGIRGNISLDPLFCEPDYDDYTLRAESPCAPEYNPDCGLIGAWPVDCTYVPGDLNCDGAVNVFDIDPFVLALTDRDGYYAVHADCYYMNADCNHDGAVNAFDIDPFVQILTGG